MSLQIIRKLAQSIDYQTLYNRAKELGTIKLFKNDTDLSQAQMVFLSYLHLYSTLYQDLHSAQDEILTEAVLEDWVRTEAYLVYRKHKNTKKTNNKVKSLVNNDGAIVFKRPPKK